MARPSSLQWAHAVGLLSKAGAFRETLLHPCSCSSSAIFYSPHQATVVFYNQDKILQQIMFLLSKGICLTCLCEASCSSSCCVSSWMALRKSSTDCRGCIPRSKRLYSPLQNLYRSKRSLFFFFFLSTHIAGSMSLVYAQMLSSSSSLCRSLIMTQ